MVGNFTGHSYDTMYCHWRKKDKPSNRKERKKRGYRNNLISIVMGIGSVYGLFAIMYAYSVIPFNE
jgi:hypothetical protein